SLTHTHTRTHAHGHSRTHAARHCFPLHLLFFVLLRCRHGTGEPARGERHGQRHCSLRFRSDRASLGPKKHHPLWAINRHWYGDVWATVVVLVCLYPCVWVYCGGLFVLERSYIHKPNTH
ncbi:MAG: hypothetical protein ACK55I_11560, partial [bacterium]